MKEQEFPEDVRIIPTEQVIDKNGNLRINGDIVGKSADSVMKAAGILKQDGFTFDEKPRIVNMDRNPEITEEKVPDSKTYGFRWGNCLWNPKGPTPPWASSEAAPKN